MARLLLAALALSVLGAIGYKVLYGRSPTTDPAAAQVPTQQLENVRNAAKRIEANDRANADDVTQKAFGSE